MDSGPIGLSNCQNSTISDSDNITKDIMSSAQPENETKIHYRSIITSGSQSTAQINKFPPTGEACGVTQRAKRRPEPECAQDGNNVTEMLTPSLNINEDEKEWQLVDYRKKKSNNRYKGQSGTAIETEFNFKAAERKIPIFITNIHKNTNEEDIISHIKLKTNETVLLEKIEIKKKTDYKAFKFLVSEFKVSMFLDKNVWPIGIIFRKFVNFKYKKTDRGSPDAGRTTT